MNTKNKHLNQHWFRGNE